MAERPPDREKSKGKQPSEAGTPELGEDESVEILEVVGMNDARPQPQREAPPGEPPEAAKEADDPIPYSRTELYDMLLRKQADFENAKKRLAREREELSRRTWTTLLESILPVLDNFDRALSEYMTDPEPGFQQGVAMTYQQLREILFREGLEEIRAVGTPFDPNLHEAVELVRSEGIEKGIVQEEMRKGYKFREHLLRPSLVKVSAGEAKQEPEQME